MVSFKYIEGKQSYVKHNKICFRTFSKSLAQGKAMDYNKNQKQRRKQMKKVEELHLLYL